MITDWISKEWFILHYLHVFVFTTPSYVKKTLYFGAPGNALNSANIQVPSIS